VCVCLLYDVRIIRLYFVKLDQKTGPLGVNPLNTELHPICHLLALLKSHRILHVSRIRVKSNLARFRFLTASNNNMADCEICYKQIRDLKLK